MKVGLSAAVAVALLVSLVAAGALDASAPIPGFRPPAVPLVLMDPYMNVWLRGTNLTDTWATYWDGTVKALVGLVRIDGTAYRFMGPEGEAGGNLPQPIQQLSSTVYPTQSVFTFGAKGVELTVTFTTPLLTDDIEVMSRPVTYLTFSVRSTDHASHRVELYYDNTAEWCVNTVDQFVEWKRFSDSRTLEVMRIGTSAQPVLQRSGDGVGIDWGYVYVATEKNDPKLQTVISGGLESRNQFVSSGALPPKDDTRMPRAASDDWPVMAVRWSLTTGPSGEPVSRYLMLAYDDRFSIKWFGTPFPPYWNRNMRPDAVEMLETAAHDYTKLIVRCTTFDRSLVNELEQAGGQKYATIAALAYRQCAGGTKLVWNTKENKLWYFMKEISSDGDLSTVDVIYPASPFFLHFNPELLRLLLVPLLEYANNETSVLYNFPWAPHHLGEYPIGYILPKDQENMPVEETGNLFMMILGIVQRQKNDLTWLFPRYSKLLEMWAGYLVASLPDPGNQLCTDDFEGPSPHNANLAAKGVVGLSAYAKILETAGNTTGAFYYQRLAEKFMSQWMQLAATNATGVPHYKLEYDIAESWSLKYNIAYQKFVGLDIFPQAVINTELNYYMKQMNTYGVPLDVRSDFTKLDWESWVGAMSDNKDDWTTIIDKIYLFADTTPDRIPLTDWYWTSTGRFRGFIARPVLGAVYAKLLLHQQQ